MKNVDLSEIVKVVKAIIFVTISVHNHELVNPLISHAGYDFSANPLNGG